MCDIAGYVGKRDAAPLLLEMIARQEKFDGSCSTGLATARGGKIFSEKMFGSASDFQATHGVGPFPGNVGVAHTRPSADYKSCAHPFLDPEGRFACAMNGIHRDVFCPAFRDDNAAAADRLIAEGVSFLSEVHYPDENRETPLQLRSALSNGNSVATGELCACLTSSGVKHGMTVAEAFSSAMDVAPSDIAGVLLSAEEETIYACRVSRPLVVAVCEDETFIATTRFAFPPEIQPISVFPLPCCTVCRIRPGTVEILPIHLKNAKVEGVSPYVYHKAYDRIRRMLENRADSPVDFDAVEDAFYTQWRDLWHDPLVDCKYAAPDGCLKQYAHVVYEVLYDLEARGLLKKKDGVVNGKKRHLMWI